jgi:hypothetical protein
LSITRQPALTASGARARVTFPPAAKKATSRFAKTPGLASSIERLWPLNTTVFPADRAEAKSLSAEIGKLRSSKRRSNS